MKLKCTRSLQPTCKAVNHHLYVLHAYAYPVCEDNFFWSGRKASRPAKLYESQRIPKTTVIFSENTGYTLALTRRIRPCNKTDNIYIIMLHGNSEYCHPQDSKLKPLQLFMAFANKELPIESCMHRSVQTGRYGLCTNKLLSLPECSQCLARVIFS